MSGHIYPAGKVSPDQISLILALSLFLFPC